VNAGHASFPSAGITGENAGVIVNVTADGTQDETTAAVMKLLGMIAAIGENSIAAGNIGIGGDGSRRWRACGRS
jgi:hypothetical protein